MSDPVTNIEIEDVLSSIRRLVSDGDKARTRDPAPEEASEEAAEAAPAEPQNEGSDSTPEVVEPSDRLVLTPAFLVPSDEAEHQDQPEESDDAPLEAADDAWEEEKWPEPEQADAAQDTASDGPFELTDLVWESVEDAKRIEAEKQAAAALQADAVETEAAEAAPQEAAAPVEPTPAAYDPAASTDRAGLVASIAELEAQISAGSDDFEPDGSEVADEVIAWPHGEADPAEAAAQEADKAEAYNFAEADDMLAFAHHKSDEPAQPEVVEPVVAQAAPEQPEPSAEDEVAGDDDLDGLLEAGGVALDEEALREMITEVVREELMGPMGERITRNVRKLVRREIYRILSSQEFD